MKDEESKSIVAVKAFELVEKKIQDLNIKLTKVERAKKSAETALNGVEKQAEAQHKQFRQAKDELTTAKNQINALTKKLEEAEKTKDQTEQDGYEAGLVRTEEALKTEVSEVCRYYFLQVWNEALDQAGVEASSTFRRAKSVYHHSAIYAPSSP